MKVQAQVSLYPLKTLHLAEPIEELLQYLRQAKLDVDCGSMSTRISGQVTDLFCALGEAFENVAESDQTVLVLKVSNACPSGRRKGG